MEELSGRWLFRAPKEKGVDVFKNDAFFKGKYACRQGMERQGGKGWCLHLVSRQAEIQHGRLITKTSERTASSL